MIMKTAFLNGDLEEETYMNQLKGFIAKRQKKQSVQIDEVLIWTKTSTKTMASEI